MIDPSAVVAEGLRGSDLTVGPYSVVDATASIGRGVQVGSLAVVSANARLADRVVVGAGAVISEGVEVDADAVVRDGAVVSRPVPRNAVVAGNPAVIVGYAGAEAGTLMQPVRQPADDTPDGVHRSTVRGVEVHRLPVVRDLRGSLVAGELEGRFPFVPRRSFFVFDVPSEEVRGEHAHHVCHQLLFCVAGQLHVIADDGDVREEFALEDRRTALYLPPMTWGIQYRYSADCVLMVLASHAYDAADYIRDYGEFLEAAGRRG